MTSDLERSFKARPRIVAREKNHDPTDLWQNLILECFLVRLARSEHRENFVLKGGILSSRYIEIGRETTDLDFPLRKIENESNRLKTVFEKSPVSTFMMDFYFKKSRLESLRIHICPTQE